MDKEYLDNKYKEFLPPNIKRAGFIISLLLIGAIVGVDILYLTGMITNAPQQLNLSGALLFLMGSALFFGVPWEKAGLSLTKFGPLGFERKLEGQSRENAEVISGLEGRIQELEKMISTLAIKPSGKFSKEIRFDILKDIPLRTGVPDFRNVSDQQAKMENLLVDFLTEYQRWSFSPLRIEKFAGKIEKYKELGANHNLLRSTLRRLVAKDILTTRISEKGNTLYRIAD